MENLQNLSATDRPREKMLLHGPTALNDTELLAILLGFGSRDLPILALCGQVLQTAGNSLEKLADMTLTDVCKIKGIGNAKGAIILAAMELGRRRLALHHKIPKIKCDEHAIRLVRPYFKNIDQQLFILVLLNKNYELLAVSELPLYNGLPELSQLMQLVVEAGAQGFGIVRNAKINDEAAENKLMADLGAAAKMLQLKYLGRIIIDDNS